jgi:hypothetical protein
VLFGGGIGLKRAAPHVSPLILCLWTRCSGPVTNASSASWDVRRQCGFQYGFNSIPWDLYADAQQDECDHAKDAARRTGALEMSEKLGIHWTGIALEIKAFYTQNPAQRSTSDTAMLRQQPAPPSALASLCPCNN